MKNNFTNHSWPSLPPAKLWYIVPSIWHMKKESLCVLWSFLPLLYHKCTGRCQRRLITAHKGWSPKQPHNLFAEGALGGRYLMSERKGTSWATEWVQIDLGCCGVTDVLRRKKHNPPPKTGGSLLGQALVLVSISFKLISHNDTFSQFTLAHRMLSHVWKKKDIATEAKN